MVVMVLVAWFVVVIAVIVVVIGMGGLVCLIGLQDVWLLRCRWRSSGSGGRGRGSGGRCVGVSRKVE